MSQPLPAQAEAASSPAAASASFGGHKGVTLSVFCVREVAAGGGVVSPGLQGPLQGPQKITKSFHLGGWSALRSSVC
jgi:hypothetical protein